MSADARERFEEALADAADILVDRHGVDGALEQLAERRQDRDERGRATEAIAYIRRGYDQ